jgi:hypothetical protein
MLIYYRRDLHACTAFPAFFHYDEPANFCNDLLSLKLCVRDDCRSFSSVIAYEFGPKNLDNFAHFIEFSGIITNMELCACELWLWKGMGPFTHFYLAVPHIQQCP